MPHVDLKYFPRNLTTQDKNALADAIAQVLKEHLGTSDEAISIAMNEIDASDWKEQVYDPIIKPSLARLAKKPGYDM